jgi:hypothetical protein
MDMREFAGTAFIGLDDVANGPIQEKIINIQKGDYGRPDLHFESGARFSLNVTNSRTLMRAFGYQSKGWIGKTVELYIGEVQYKGEMQKSVLARPITLPSQADNGNNNAVASPSPRNDLDDEIPF